MSLGLEARESVFRKSVIWVVPCMCIMFLWRVVDHLGLWEAFVIRDRWTGFWTTSIHGLHMIVFCITLLLDIVNNATRPYYYISDIIFMITIHHEWARGLLSGKVDIMDNGYYKLMNFGCCFFYYFINVFAKNYVVINCLIELIRFIVYNVRTYTPANFKVSYKFYFSDQGISHSLVHEGASMGPQPLSRRNFVMNTILYTFIH